MEDTFIDAARADSVWAQMRDGEKSGRIGRGYGPQYYASAVIAGVINKDDEAFINDYEAAVRRVIDVDDFAPDSLANNTTSQ